MEKKGGKGVFFLLRRKGKVRKDLKLRTAGKGKKEERGNSPNHHREEKEESGLNNNYYLAKKPAPSY